MNFAEFKAKYEHQPVTEYPHRVTSEPIVSVCVMTYQHKDFIRECLDGILAQQTNFPFEILLGEDASTDGTREICIEYAQKYPDKIRLFLHRRENNIRIGSTPTGRFNFLYNLYSARGKYIALCEGDDYWTDPNKLQMQLDFLKAHPDYALCFHAADRITGNEVTGSIPKQLDKETLTIHDLIPGWIYPTASLTFTSKVVQRLPTWITHSPMGDIPLVHILADMGKVRYMNKTMSVYRMHPRGVSNQTPGFKRFRSRHTVFTLLDKHFQLRYHYEYRKVIAREMRHHLSVYRDQTNFVTRAMLILYVYWMEAPLGFRDRAIYFANLISPHIYTTYLGIKNRLRHSS